MGNKFPKKYRIPIIIAIAVACIFSILATVFTYAAFTSSLHAQRTIAAYDTAGDKFSSNYLLKNESRENIRTIYSIGDNTPAAAVVTVCNYQQGRQTMPADEDITYQITANLVYYDSNAQAEYVQATPAYITSNSLTDYTVTVSIGSSTLTLGGSTVTGTLPASVLEGGDDESDVYSVLFTPNFSANMPNLYLELIATPSTQGYQPLRGIFMPELRAAGASDHWSGSFSDDTATPPSGYDGFNYLVTGAGSGVVSLTWETDKIDISSVSLRKLLAITGAQYSAGQITFPVDSDVESRYDLQFYKVPVTDQTPGITTETWQDMNNSVVRFHFA